MEKESSGAASAEHGEVDLDDDDDDEGDDYNDDDYDDLVRMASQVSWHYGEDGSADLADPWPLEDPGPIQSRFETIVSVSGGAEAEHPHARAQRGERGGRIAPQLPFRPPPLPKRPSASVPPRPSETVSDWHLPQRPWFQPAVMDPGASPALNSPLPPYAPPSIPHSRLYPPPSTSSLVHLLPVEGPPPPQQNLTPPSAPSYASTPLSGAPALADAIMAVSAAVSQRFATSGSSSSHSSPAPPEKSDSPQTYFVNVSCVSCVLARMRLPHATEPASEPAKILSTAVFLTRRFPIPRTHPAFFTSPITALRVSGQWEALRHRLPPNFVVLPVAQHRRNVYNGDDGVGEELVEAAINVERILGVHPFDSKWTTVVIEADVRARKLGNVGEFGAQVLASFSAGPATRDFWPGMVSGIVKEEVQRRLLSFEVAMPILDVLRLVDEDGFVDHGVSI
ncbi:hypothetical protein DFJ73DRAFT_839847 [Zopfochytrium polystomum]|nr:hypothetical protein DFJ73DRAFT_839847 [Zopfochytrium polystomum]